MIHYYSLTTYFTPDHPNPSLLFSNLRCCSQGACARLRRGRGHGRRPPEVREGERGGGDRQGRGVRAQQGQRDRLRGRLHRRLDIHNIILHIVVHQCQNWLTPGDGEDVLGAADHVARLPVGLRLRALRRVAVEALHPLHQTQGLRPLHCVSNKYDYKNI